MSALATVEVGYDADMGVSVYVKGKSLHKSDYVTHYAVKRTMTVEEYASIYDYNKNYTPTLFQLRERDYMYLYRWLVAGQVYQWRGLLRDNAINERGNWRRRKE